MNLKLFALLVISLLIMTCQKSNQEQHPNIIYILADDMGYGDIKGLNINSKIPTPHLDQLINEGISFSDAHSNSAVCTPTRYGTLTGRYCFRSRLKSGVLVGHEAALIEDSIKTVAQVLNEANYQTACVGKWHLGLNWAKKDSTKALFHGGNLWDIFHTDNVDYTARASGGPCDVGFDYSFIIPASLDIAPYVYLENDVATAPVPKQVPFFRDEKARGMWYRRGDIAGDFDHTTVLQTITNKAIDFITSANKEQPFFLYFPLTSPHTPWFPTEEFQGQSQAGVYGDFVAMTDDVVGQIMQTIEKQGITDNTILIFTSDNGSHWLPSDIERFKHTANHAYSGMKSDIWEGGHRVPFIVRWPEKIKAQSTSTKAICSTDLMASLAELTLQDIPESAEDSYSFLSALKGASKVNIEDRVMIHHSVNGTFAIRKGPWKLIDTKGSGGWSLPEDKCDKDAPPQQLFNMEDDIVEQNNRYSEYPEIVRDLNTLLWKYKEGNEAR
ncbi:sulfatase family protein [Carboxylicivirga marina]|uniref:Arylsulfatase n=1 Tax=Carboxylicivirga marina TaxID=2800988 RepID=A0ABS1HE70_9BACT|nr:arylsulfatase [Carboxylicivirga marina]MBK3515790.1 arylsulfatase [Carboxylicivirga marina]